MLPCKCYQFCNHVSSPTWSSSSIRRFQRRSKTPLFPGSVYFKKSNKTLKVQWVSPNHESRNAHVLNPKLQSFPLYWISDTECTWYLEFSAENPVIWGSDPGCTHNGNHRDGSRQINLLIFHLQSGVKMYLSCTQSLIVQNQYITLDFWFIKPFSARSSILEGKLNEPKR